MPRARSSWPLAALLLLVACGAPSASTCAAGWSACAGICTNTALDPSHCGACGNACGAGSLCAAGRCVAVCGAGTTRCGERCVDVSATDAHCGACGNACGEGQRCVAGSCARVSCPTGTTRCGEACVDVRNDPAHCGACDNACGAGERCAGGTCVPGCDGGHARCAGRCVDPRNDPAHCGACGNACGEGQVCAAGCARRAARAAPRAATGRVDLQRDPRHCGACGNACAAGEVCDEARCARRCPEGQAACGARCVDPRHDPAHCGACGNACAEGSVCAQGACRVAMSSCGEGQQRCAGQCVDTRNDPAHCGACDNACAEGEACREGACVPLGNGCLSSQRRCGGACTFMQTDAMHCGACGQACRAGERCVGGSCACALGATSCRTTAGTRCVDLASDPAHCGACNRACASDQTCAAGTCRARVFCEQRPGNPGACALFPPRINECGGAPTVIRDRFTGRVENFRETIPLGPLTAPGAIVRLDGLFRSLNNGFGGTIFRLALDNAVDERLAATDGIVTTPRTMAISYMTGIPACQRPVVSRVETQVISEGEYELDRTITIPPNYNLAGITLETAAPIPFSNNDLCAVRCGFIHAPCGDSGVHYYRVDIPAGRALALSLAGERTTIGRTVLQVLRADGLRYCDDVTAGSGDVPDLVEQRVVNASTTTQTVVFALRAAIFAPRYSFNLALEPLP
ncbi:MAG: MXAN_6577-like cysteine-rich protein [Polyangiales bacterium]